MTDSAQPIFSTRDFMEAQAACEELRAHGVRCASVESLSISARVGNLSPLIPPYGATPSGMGHTGQWDVIVAPDDVERASDILRAWLNEASS